MKHDPNAVMCVCLDCWRADVADEKQRKNRRNAAVDALMAIVKDAEDRNEPGQSWVTIRAGLIDEAKQALSTSGVTPK